MVTNYFLLFLPIFIIFSGCASLSTAPEAKVDKGLEDELPPYSGKKASLAVARFEWKVDAGRQVKVKAFGQEISYSEQESSYMDGLRDMLTTTLVQSKRFRVLERQELDSVKAEQALSASGDVEKETKIAKGKIKGADILVIAAVTAWEPGIKKTGGNLAGALFGPAGAAAAAVSGAVKKSFMAMDIRIVDSATSEVLAATRVEGLAKEFSLGSLAGGIFGNVPLGGGLSIYSKTPMEKAIRLCIKEAVKYIIENTPQEYYKY
jgi:curli biogenesis system outer membrane secretion channel CsgG